MSAGIQIKNQKLKILNFKIQLHQQHLLENIFQFATNTYKICIFINKNNVKKRYLIKKLINNQNLDEEDNLKTIKILEDQKDKEVAEVNKKESVWQAV
ncbi:unnamed protein product [Paramecium pentaurelia]|uniref:Uncharacterized protein n=1 Tax=Paramecium pentaurelia TaxID=43138 RepID=A0A8S1TI30_9CILI|nr:unnamed protein product [Paramecium pentaurelia]